MNEPLLFHPPHSDEAVAALRMLRAMGFRIEYQAPHTAPEWRDKSADSNPDVFFDRSIYRAIRPK